MSLTSLGDNGERLLQAARNQLVDRPPIWIMRQAGRYLKAYRELSQKYPSFRERSETPDLAIEISLQPFYAFKPDGVILFSDILTPLPGIGIPFEILESQGPILQYPIRSQTQVDALTPLDPETTLPFICPILRTLRQEVAGQATVLGFVGAPWTLATYAIEGQNSVDYRSIKSMAFREPKLLHQLLNKLADAIAIYAQYQIDCGAQMIQIFDSWAGRLTPQDYETFVLPYQQKVVRQVKSRYPETPLTLCVHDSASLLHLMARSGVDVVHIDWTIPMKAAREHLGNLPVQGNLDPCVLLGTPELIEKRTLEIIQQAGDRGHIMNLGQGILNITPEENVAFFFETVKQSHRKIDPANR
ncbi:MAG TPA: uroporphyrinogen decarboxylase [Oscillatoriales cyanobacterium M59_W2019_021]|nr:MAG: uroporphyrinogen decarboxylase [Cyanobacteria bacterium J055]HIK31077.1 uroporphyrinogen decarboxylase [Oscillatoriales cyanobacterium M4454_W2019_049]HIK51147.1 uroporphyrinogen decarboxylase [Oscillatoriales cyanobacterium M59_W2019_021]